MVCAKTGAMNNEDANEAAAAAAQRRDLDMRGLYDGLAANLRIESTTAR